MSFQKVPVEQPKRQIAFFSAQPNGMWKVPSSKATASWTKTRMWQIAEPFMIVYRTDRKNSCGLMTSPKGIGIKKRPHTCKDGQTSIKAERTTEMMKVGTLDGQGCAMKPRRMKPVGWREE